MSLARKAIGGVAVALAGLAGLALTAAPAGAAPANLVWKCTVPAGYTWTKVAFDGRCGTAPDFLTTLPAAGLTVCWVPPGWVYSDTRSALNVCVPNGTDIEYRLSGHS